MQKAHEKSADNAVIQPLDSGVRSCLAFDPGFAEMQVFRIDHYLGKELTQNLTILRFANAVIEPSWNRHFISNIQICFKVSVRRVGGRPAKREERSRMCKMGEMMNLENREGCESVQ